MGEEYTRYLVGDQPYEFPSSMSEEEALKIIAQDRPLPQAPDKSAQAASGQQQSLSYEAAADDLDPDTLYENEDWLRASRQAHMMRKGRSWKGSDKDLAEYGLDLMGWFNYNLPAMGVQAAEVGNASPEEKQGFLYLMDTYDKVDSSWAGAARFAKGVLSDPSTYVGLGTLGIGTAAREAAKVAAKESIRALLKQGAKVGTVAGIEGGIYATADNTMRQSVEISAGRKQEIDLSEAATAAALGTGMGFAGGTAISMFANKIAQKFSKNAVDSTPLDAPDISRKTAEQWLGKDAPHSTEAQPQPQMDAQPTGVKATTEPSVAPSIQQPAPPKPAPKIEGIVARTLGAQAEHAVDGESDAVMGELIHHVKLDDLSLPELDLSIPYVKQKISENVSKAMNLANEFKNLDHAQIDDIVGQLRTHKFSMDEMEQFSLSAGMAKEMVAKELAITTKIMQQAKSREEIVDLLGKGEQLGKLYPKLEAMSSALNSHYGYGLRQAQVVLNTKNLPPIQDDVAFSVAVFKAAQEQETKRLELGFDRRIKEALDGGDMAKVGSILTEKKLKMDAILNANTGGMLDRAIRKVNELFISNVFSTTTILVNVAPTGAKMLYRPALNALLSNPFEAATRKEMVATYSAMRGSVGTAWRASQAAFRYEQAILTRESGRLMEGELALKGKTGAYIRFFPRLLNATDEFMSHMVYQGHVAGEGAADAYEIGFKKGLRGEKLDKFVEKATNKAIDDSYSAATDVENIQVILNKAKNLYTDSQDMADYVAQEMQRNLVNVKHGNDKDAVSYVQEMLYKKNFSEEGASSKVAAGYERMINDAPILRLLGQLFFRTPVRVFEEGIRMTPGVQIFAPHFLSDLAGKNGQRAQIRAQGEAMMSLAFTGTVLSLYAQGKIAGDGAYSHWKQQQNRTNSDMPEPYTLKFDDGSTWSFKYFDPIGTPMKIIVNALERYDDLVTKEKQGELIDQTDLARAVAAITVGTGAIAQALRDANLASGIDGAIRVGDSMGDPVDNETKWIKLFGEKIRMLVPNTLHKIALGNDPELDDPATFWQMIESKLLKGASLGAYEGHVPKSYDILGNVRKITDPTSLWWIFSTNTPEERQKGKSEVELDVLRKLDWISKQTDTTFRAPYTHEEMGKTDLRTVMTKDGKESLYDRWSKYYKEKHVEDLLQPILDSGMPVGTKTVDGAMVGVLKEVINSQREAAFYQLMSEEMGISEKMVKDIKRKASVQAGFWDVRRPFQ